MHLAAAALGAAPLRQQSGLAARQALGARPRCQAPRRGARGLQVQAVAEAQRSAADNSSSGGGAAAAASVSFSTAADGGATVVVVQGPNRPGE